MSAYCCARRREAVADVSALMLDKLYLVASGRMLLLGITAGGEFCRSAYCALVHMVLVLVSALRWATSGRGRKIPGIGFSGLTLLEVLHAYCSTCVLHRGQRGRCASCESDELTSLLGVHLSGMCWAALGGGWAVAGAGRAGGRRRAAHGGAAPAPDGPARHRRCLRGRLRGGWSAQCSRPGRCRCADSCPLQLKYNEKVRYGCRGVYRSTFRV